MRDRVAQHRYYHSGHRLRIRGVAFRSWYAVSSSTVVSAHYLVLAPSRKTGGKPRLIAAPLQMRTRRNTEASLDIRPAA